MGDSFPSKIGRPKGSRNKRTVEFLETLQAAGFDPAEALISTYKIAMEKFIEESEKVESGRLSPMESNALGYLKLAGDKAGELASYAYPKLKAIDKRITSFTEDMTSQEKLDAARLMVEVFQDEVKNEPKPSE